MTETFSRFVLAAALAFTTAVVGAEERLAEPDDARLVVVPLAAPNELVFDDLVLVKSGLWNGDRKGRLVLRGETLGWEGRHNQKEDFTFQTTGLEKVWFTCEARSSESFCYQLNFKIVKGDRYRFRDRNGDSGSNAAITEVMEALRTQLPRLDFAAPTMLD